MAELYSPDENFEEMYSLLYNSAQQLRRNQATFDLSFYLGPMPATRASIEAMRRVQVTEEEAAAGLECPICLENYKVGVEAREMPCKHRFHSGCIKEWLRRHASCPICRFVMPAEERKPERWNGEAGRRGGHSSLSGGGNRGWDLLEVDRVTDRGSGVAGRNRSQGADEIYGAGDQMGVDAQFDFAWNLMNVGSDGGMWMRRV